MSKVLVETIIFSIPEAIVIVLLASSILGRKLKLTSLISIGIIFGIISPWIRLATGNYISNIILSSLVIIVLLKVFGQYDIFYTMTAVLMAISLYLAIEFINVKTIQILTGIDPIHMGQNLLLRTLWFLPQIIVATGLVFVCRYFVSHQSS